MQSEYKQKQVEALTLIKSVKLEAQPISFAVGGWFTASPLAMQIHWTSSKLAGARRLI